MSEKDYDWVVMDTTKQPYILRCTRCGATAQSPTSPIGCDCRVSDAVSMMYAFVENHKKCIEKKVM